VSRIVLVTGGGNGLGKAVAARFLAGGDTVIITGRNAGRLAGTAAEIGARPVTCDATDPRQVAELADANLLSAVLTTTAVLGRLRSGGSIINVGSIGAEYASTSYGAAKAALAAWTAGLSAEVGPRGLTANVISPGYITGTGFFGGRLTGQRQAALIAATHDGRAGQPSDIAETAYFLASAGARHITGQILHVNGGAHTTR